MMCVYIYIYIYRVQAVSAQLPAENLDEGRPAHRRRRLQAGDPSPRSFVPLSSFLLVLRDFKDTVCLFFESEILFLEIVFVLHCC